MGQLLVLIEALALRHTEPFDSKLPDMSNCLSLNRLVTHCGIGWHWVALGEMEVNRGQPAFGNMRLRSG